MFNKKWGGPLFCSDGKDSADDHWAKVESRRNYESNGKERVYIKRQSDGTYKIFSKKWKGPLFCSDHTHDLGDHWTFFEERPSYENNGKERWTIERQKDGHFKLFNKKWGGPLFCADSRDGLGDFIVLVEPRKSYEKNGKERWEFEKIPSAVISRPLTLEDGEYKMFNKKWGGPLFCSDSKDSSDDHWAWVEARRNYENNGKERVYLKKQSDGTYKIFSKKWKGPLFCSDYTDDLGDHWTFFEERPSYENNGKERWTIERQNDGHYKLFNKKWGGPLFCADSKDWQGHHRVWVEQRKSYESNEKERWEFEQM